MARTARPQNPNVCDGSAWHPPWSSFRDREETMTKFLAGVLTVIAAGVMLIAYGLLSPRVGAFASPGDVNGFAQPMFASEQGMIRNARRTDSTIHRRPRQCRSVKSGPCGLSRRSLHPPARRKHTCPAGAIGKQLR